MTRKQGIFVASILAASSGFLLLPQISAGQAAGMPASAGAALRSGWQMVHFAVGYATLPAVGTSSISVDLIETNFGTDEVHYFVLRKENSYILCYQQLVMKPKAMRYDPWKRECIAVQ